MNASFQRVLHILGAIAAAFLLYVVPDMVANLGETLSFRLKSIVAIALLLSSIVLETKRKSPWGTLALTAGIALGVLLFAGGAIRLNELF
jgi:hypothetical protein